MMKRIKKHKIKMEQPGTSTSQPPSQEDYDLAYFNHDRVELMHQVFSVLRHKDVKAMAPECVRNISIDDLQELCTEELLGISSKRLCAILDGADTPSDTESSASASPARVETISLDSISSDEEILSQSSTKKKKHKHRHRKTKKPKSPPDEPSQSRASRAGLTVLELLELQARARAIRAQLQKEQAAKKQSESVAGSAHQSDQDDIEIKEEAAEVVEISSDEEKPKIEPEEKSITTDPESPHDSQAVIKRNNLIITVPQTKQTRKIKLNRTISTVTDAYKQTAGSTSANTADRQKTATEDKQVGQTSEKTKSTSAVIVKSVKISKDEKPKPKKKVRKRGKKRTVNKEGSDYDEISLQLSDTEKMDLLEDLDRKHFDTLSSSSSEDSESSSSDSGSESQEKPADKPVAKETKTVSQEKEEKRQAEEALVKGKEVEVTVGRAPIEESKTTTEKERHEQETEISANIKVVKDKMKEKQILVANLNVDEKIADNIDENNKEIGGSNSSNKNDTPIDNVATNSTEKNKEDITDEIGNSCITEIENSVDEMSSMKLTDASTSQSTSKHVENDSHKDAETNESGNVLTQIDVVEKEADSFLVVTSVEDIPLAVPKQLDTMNETTTGKEIDVPVKKVEKYCILLEKVIDLEQDSEIKDTCQIPETIIENVTDKDVKKQTESKELSEGELSERASSEVEAFEPQPEVVCISDDDTSKKTQKKKKKKEKKHKKEKKSKKSKSDFREGGDQNFYKEPNTNDTATQNKEIVQSTQYSTDDIYEILELSDDSSCLEVEGTVLSKEPTTEEIEALSDKIDQIEREDVVTEKEIREYEQMQLENSVNTDDNLEQISWKDRYLDSNKVKKVLSTSGIFNALRKKNRELKKKLEQSKKKKEIQEIVTEVEETIENVEEGSIEQFNALQGSNTYVNPVLEKEKIQNEVLRDGELITDAVKEITPVTREMKKDAKQLLKIYKRLLKYNNVTKQRDPTKKKKSKKKSKDSV